MEDIDKVQEQDFFLVQVVDITKLEDIKLVHHLNNTELGQLKLKQAFKHFLLQIQSLILKVIIIIIMEEEEG